MENSHLIDFLQGVYGFRLNIWDSEELSYQTKMIIVLRLKTVYFSVLTNMTMYLG